MRYFSLLPPEFQAEFLHELSLLLPARATGNWQPRLIMKRSPQPGSLWHTRRRLNSLPSTRRASGREEGSGVNPYLPIASPWAAESGFVSSKTIPFIA